MIDARPSVLHDPAPPPFSISRACSSGAAILRARPGLLVLVSVVYLALAVVASCVPLGVVFLLPLTAGCLHAGVRVARAEQVEIADLFRPYATRLLDLIVAGLLMSVASLPAIVPAFLGAIAFVTLPAAMNSGGSDALAAALVATGTILVLTAIAIGNYTTARLIFADLLVLDRVEPGFWGVDAIKASWALTRGRAWSLFWFFLLLTLLYVASALLCGVGIVVVGTPLWFAGVAGAYVTLRGEACRMA